MKAAFTSSSLMRFPGSPLCPRFCSSVPSPIIPRWIMGRGSLASFFASFGSGLSVTGKSFVSAVSGRARNVLRSSNTNPTGSVRVGIYSIRRLTSSATVVIIPAMISSKPPGGGGVQVCQRIGPASAGPFLSAGIPKSKSRVHGVGREMDCRPEPEGRHGWRDDPVLRTQAVVVIRSSGEFAYGQGDRRTTMNNIMWRALTGATVLYRSSELIPDQSPSPQLEDQGSAEFSGRQPRLPRRLRAS